MSEASLVPGGSPAVRLERRVPHPPPAVWRAITDRDALRDWFPCDVEVAGGRWTPGARLTFRFPAEVIDMTLSGEVLEVDEPSRLAYTWGEEVLRFELTPDGDGTRLVLIDELPAGAAARNAAGWEDCLDRLLGLEPSPDAWQTRFDRYAVAFESVLGHQEGPPPGYKGGKPDRSSGRREGEPG